MKYINLKSLIISLSIGVASLLMSFNGFKIYLFDLDKTIEVSDMIVLIGAAITGPIGAVIISIISKSQQLFIEKDFLEFTVQLFSLIIFSLANKRFLEYGLTLVIFTTGWIVLLIFYYFILPLPVMMFWSLISPDDLLNQSSQNNIFNLIKFLFKSEILQFLFTTIFTTLMMISLPNKIKNTLWLKKVENKTDSLSETKNTLIHKNLFTIRLFVWFLIITIIPLSVLITSIIREYSISVLKQEAILRENMAESLAYRLGEINREQVRQFLEGVKVSSEGELFILDTLGNYLFAKDTLKFKKSSMMDYSEKNITEILNNKTGHIIDEKNKISMGYTTLDGEIHKFKVVFVSDPNKLITLSSDLFNNLIGILGFSTLVISFSFIMILWILVRNPIGKLTNVVEKISSGKYDIRANDEDFIDDIKILASSFNQMADKIISSEKRFRELSEALPLAVCEVDLSGKILYVNSKCYDVFGYEPEDYNENMNVLDFLDNTEKERAVSNINKLFQGIKDDDEDYIAVKKDGSKFPVAIYSSIISNENIPVGFRAVIIDLTEKKEAQAKLNESIKKLEFIANAVNIGFWEYDYETKNVFRSEKWAEMLGYTQQEIPPTRDFWLNLIHPEDRLKTEQSVIEIDNGLISNYQTIHRLKCKNGNYKWIFNYGKITEFNKEGKPRKSSGIHIDVDEKIKTEEKLKDTEEKFSTMLEGLSDIITIINPDAKFEYVSPSFLKKFGYQSDEVIGKNILDFCHPDDLEFLGQEFSKSLNNIDNDIPITFRMKSKTNQYYFIEAVASNFMQNSAVNGIVVFGRDVTERILSERKIKESEEKFSKAFVSSPIALALTKLETGEYIDVNESWEKVFGFNKKDIIGKTSIEIGIYLNPEERDTVISQIKKDKSLKNYEILFRQNSGKTIYAFWSAEIITINNEEFLLSSVYDFTKQKEFEKKIIESEEKFKSIIQGLNDLIIIIGADGKVSYISPSVIKNLGYSEEELIGMSPLEFIHPDDVELAKIELEEIFQSANDGIESLYRVRCKDGSYVYIESVGINMLSNEFVKGVVIFGKNVTEQIISRRNLQESEMRFSNLLLHIQDPILLLSFDGFVRYANPACFKLIQADESMNLIGISFTKFMKENEIEGAFNDLNRVKETGGPITSVYEIVTSKGEMRWISAKGIKITFDNEDVNLLTIKDITEIKNAQNVLELSEKRFKSVWENTLDAMRITDEIGTIVVVNQAYCDLVKKPREELIGFNLSVVSLEKFREQVRNDYIFNFKNRNLKTKYETDIELWNDEILYVEVVHTFLTIENQTDLLLTVFHNITDRVEANKRLKENEERFRITVEQTDQIFYDMDVYTGKIIWNGAVEKLTGYSVEEFSEVDLNKWEEMIHIDDRENAISLFNKAVSERSTYLCEYRFLKKDGNYMIVEDKAVVLQEENKHQLRMLGSLKDITEQKLAIIREEERTQRIERQSAALFEILKNEFVLNGDFPSAIKFISEKVSEILNVERVSVWLLESKDTILVCKNLFLLSQKQHFEGESFNIEDYPKYFRALETHIALVANDVLNDKRVVEFKDNYLVPLNIKSMLDISFKESGKTVGIICIEQVNEMRYWTEDEITFVTHVAEQLSILFSNYQKRFIEKELEKSERQYRTLIESLNEVIIFVDNEDRVLFVNEKFKELLGYSSEEIIGKIGYEVLLHPSEKHKIIKANFERLKGRGGQYEAKFVKKNGETIDFLINGSPVFDDKGNVIGSLGAMTDISERKKAEELIRIKSENFKRIFDVAPFGMVISTLGPESLILNVNKAHCEIIERSIDELINKKTDLFIEKSLLANLSSKFQAEGMIKDFEYSFVTPKGNKKIVLLSTFFIEYDNQLCSLSIIEDITKRKQIEIELEQYRLNLENLIKERTNELEIVNKQLVNEIIKQKEAEEKVRKALEKEKELNELKTKFISIASHEFRTPLATMLSSTELIDLFHKNNVEEKFQIQLERIRNNIKHLTEIMDDFLVISRSDSGRIKCEKILIESSYFLKEIIEDTKILLSLNHQLNFINTIEKELIYIDPKLFRIVLMNLLANAIKYSPEGGVISFEVYKQRKKIIFKISDQGIGIPSKDLKNLFEPFHRSDNVGNIRGTGLGLTIVKKYVELHKGAIEVTSVLNQGSTFTIKLPIN